MIPFIIMILTFLSMVAQATTQFILTEIQEVLPSKAVQVTIL